MVSYVVAYFNTVERIQPVAKPKMDLLKSLKGMARNRPLLGLMVTNFALLTVTITSGTLNAYLFKDYFHEPKLLALAGMVQLAAMIAVIPFIQMLVKRFGKKETSVGGLALAIVVYAVMFLFPTKSAYVFMGLQLLATIGFATLNVLGLTGYVSGAATQNEVVASGIRDAITLIPVIGLLICLLAMAFIYNLSKANVVRMNEQLAQIRKDLAG